MEYIIVLPNEKARTYRYVTLFILLINCLVFGFVFFNTVDKHVNKISLTGTIISFLSLILFLINFYTKKFGAYRSEISFIILAVLWFILGKYLLALCILCFAVIGSYTNKKFKVAFTDTKIIYPSFPVKTFLWSEVSNVMMKDNVLTIDLKSNKLIQVVIENKSIEEIDETSFNDFCQRNLKI